jgi:hypothetical protein
MSLLVEAGFGTKLCAAPVSALPQQASTRIQSRGLQMYARIQP